MGAIRTVLANFSGLFGSVRPTTGLLAIVGVIWLWSLPATVLLSSSRSRDGIDFVGPHGIDLVSWATLLTPVLMFYLIARIHNRIDKWIGELSSPIWASDQGRVKRLKRLYFAAAYLPVSGLILYLVFLTALIILEAFGI